MRLPRVAILDTSVFVEILGVPGRCAQQEELLRELKDRVNRGDELLLPLATIFETGNHIAQAATRRRAAAKKFVEEVGAALDGNRPYRAIIPVEPKWLKSWLDTFPNHANAGLGFADVSLIEEWKRMRRLVGDTRRVEIWTLDKHLAGYDQ